VFRRTVCGFTSGVRKVIREHVRTEHKELWREQIRDFKKHNPLPEKPKKDRPHISDYYERV